MRRRPPPGTSHPLVAVRAVAALSAVLAAVVGAGTGWGSPRWWAVPLLAALVAGAEVAVVHLQFGRQRWTFSLTEAAIAGALACAGGAWTVVGVAVGVAVAQRLRRQQRLKLQYNVAQFAAATALAELVAAHTGGGVLGACVGIAAFWTVNYLLVAVAVCLTSDRGLASVLVGSAPVSALHTSGNSSIGLLAAHLAQTAPVGLAGLLVPLAMLWVSFDQETRRSAEARLYAELARGQERAISRSTDVSAKVVLTAAARLFGGAEVEMLMLAAEGPVRYVGDEDDVPRRLRVEQDAFDEPWVLRAIAGGRIAVGTEDGRPWCAAVLGDQNAPQAVLVARRPAGSAPFGRGDVRLAEVLVGQAETWLSISDLSDRNRAVTRQVRAADGAARALGDLAARTTPALSVLRDSAARLTELTEGSAGVHDIVEELQVVERAVASLLGAVALAAEPDLVGSAPSAPGAREVLALPAPARPATDWTTTGTLR